MFNLKQLNLDPEETYGNFLKGLFKHAIMQAAMIKGAKKQRVGDENGTL